MHRIYGIVVHLVLLLTAIHFGACDREEVPQPAKIHDHGRSHGGKSASDQLLDDDHSAHLDHQAILGSERLANEFDDMQPEEAMKRLRVLAIKQIDKNGDGVVTLVELTDYIHNSLVSLDREETEERFDELDTNKDGLVSWAEYVQEAFGIEPGQESQRLMESPEDARLLKEDEKYFSAADQDGDRTLDRQEFAAFQNPEHFLHMHKVLVENTMMEKDTNADGRIDLKEFLGETFDQPNSEWYTTEKNRFETDYDKDRDGYLTGEEINAWLIPDIRGTAKQEAEHLMKVADTDKNGELSIEEIVGSHKAFVGSEATSYGEKLMDIPHEEL